MRRGYTGRRVLGWMAAGSSLLTVSCGGDKLEDVDASIDSVVADPGQLDASFSPSFDGSLALVSWDAALTDDGAILGGGKWTAGCVCIDQQVFLCDDLLACEGTSLTMSMARVDGLCAPVCAARGGVRHDANGQALPNKCWLRVPSICSGSFQSP